jgi:hypothetical protein
MRKLLTATLAAFALLTAPALALEDRCPEYLRPQNVVASSPTPGRLQVNWTEELKWSEGWSEWERYMWERYTLFYWNDRGEWMSDSSTFTLRPPFGSSQGVSVPVPAGSYDSLITLHLPYYEKYGGGWLGGPCFTQGPWKFGTVVR